MSNWTKRELLYCGILFIIYFALSTLLFLSQSHAGIAVRIEKCWGWVFLLGPPAALIHGPEFLWFYLGSSAAFWGLVAFGCSEGNRLRPLCVVLSVVLWFAAGWLSIAILV
jgi:hypothetical protein